MGIALITTMLVHREAAQRAPLVERISLYRPEAMSRLNTFVAAFGRHSDDPVRIHKQAYAALDGIVNGQAALKSYADIFLYVGAAFFFTLPLLFFLDAGKNKAAAAAAH